MWNTQFKKLYISSSQQQKYLSEQKFLKMSFNILIHLEFLSFHWELAPVQKTQ